MLATNRVPRTVGFLLAWVLTTACDDDASGRSPRVLELTGPELVPRELVAALLSGPYGPGPAGEIFVGRIPDEMSFEVPEPVNARIVGALAQRSSGTLVFAVRERPLDAMKSYRELLRRTGWDDRGRERGSGFHPSEVVRPGTFCQGDDRSITTMAAEREDGETYLRVLYSETGRRSMCNDARNDDMAWRRGPMPSLYPPKDAQVLDGNVGGGRNYTQASARLKTELRPAQLIAHYAAQLRADGWAPRSEPSGTDVVGQTWRIEDRRGSPWIGALVAITVPDSPDRELIFRVMSPEATRDR
jgi:hypothetical protein